MYSLLMLDAAEAISRGRQARKDGNLPLAREFYAGAAALYLEQEESLAYAHAIRHIADIYREEGRLSEAKTMYEECLELYRSNLDTRLLDLANAIRPYALLLEEQGEFDPAKKLWEEARHLYAAIRLEQGVLECEVHLYGFTP